jgi:hypothetical protein
VIKELLGNIEVDGWKLMHYLFPIAFRINLVIVDFDVKGARN